MGLPAQLLSIPRPRNKTLVAIQGDTFYRKWRVEYKDANGVWQAVDISGCEIEFIVTTDLNPENEGSTLFTGTADFITDGEDGWFYTEGDAEDINDIEVSTDEDYRTVYYRVRFSAPSDEDSAVDEIRTPFYGEFHVLPTLDTGASS